MKLTALYHRAVNCQFEYLYLLPWEAINLCTKYSLNLSNAHCIITNRVFRCFTKYMSQNLKNYRWEFYGYYTIIAVDQVWIKLLQIFTEFWSSGHNLIFPLKLIKVNRKMCKVFDHKAIKQKKTNLCSYSWLLMESEFLWRETHCVGRLFVIEERVSALHLHDSASECQFWKT